MIRSKTWRRGASQFRPHKEVTRRFEDTLAHIALAGIVEQIILERTVPGKVWIGSARNYIAVALFAAIPALALASSFEKDYTESMLFPDAISMAEAKLMIIDKIRLDALNDAGARLKKVTVMTRTGTTDTDPTSTFSKTMVSLIHVGSTQYSSSINKDGQTELTATAHVTVDDTELQQADEVERKTKTQEQRIAQLEHENHNLKTKIETNLQEQRIAQADQMIGEQRQDQSTLEKLANSPVQPPRSIPSVNISSIQPDASLSQDERNSNTLTIEQQFRFDQLCERFKAVDQIILNAGVQTSFGVVVNSKEKSVTPSFISTWNWTKEMEIIRHLMGDVGTIDGDAYTVRGNEVNDKAVLVAVRKCERANHFYIRTNGSGNNDLLQAFMPSITDPNGLTYFLLFRGEFAVGPYDVKINNPAPSVQIVDTTKGFLGDKNRFFGTDGLTDPNSFGNEEMKASARDAAKKAPPPAPPKHNGFVSFFGRVFAAGVTGNNPDQAKCAEYGGVFVQRFRPSSDPYGQGANGTYYSCEPPGGRGP